MAHVIGPVVGLPNLAQGGLLDRGNTDFAKSATKKWGWKSHSLDLLIAAITNYQNNPSEDGLREVNRHLISWMAKNPQESRIDKRGSDALALKQEISQIARDRQWTLCDAPEALISDVIRELNRCKTFACTDVGTFAGDINPALSRARRDLIYTSGIRLGQGTGRPIIPRGDLPPGAWDPDALRSAYDKVFKAQAGECTSFAKAAAHILTTKQAHYLMPRIEIVSFRNPRLVPRFNRDGTPLYKKGADGNPTNQQAMERQYVTHVFCVVGRAGQEVQFDARMPDKGTWSADCRIVDCWLGALGYECSYRVQNYPKDGYLTTGLVYKEMDSYEGPKAVR